MFRFMTVATIGLFLATGCKKNKDFDEPQGTPNKGGPVVVGPATASVPTVTTSGPMSINNGGGSGGAVQAVRKAVTRIVDANDLKNLHLFIENFSAAGGQMPDAKSILAALKSDPEGAKTAKLIEDEVIILTNIKQREGIWAYPKAALTDGGWVLFHGGPQRITNVELQEKLKQQQ